MSRLVPSLVDSIRTGYSARTFLRDLTGGLTVGVISLPLAMAFGIASLPANATVPVSPPACGLYTAIIAGFLISALGGSRVQIGGPTGAFIVIVYGVAARHGYTGLTTATMMAGAIVILMGVSGLGRVIKFIPFPVITGFTTGIALIIATSQVKDLLGLPIENAPPEFLAQWRAYGDHFRDWDTATAAVGVGTFVLLIVLRCCIPRIPWGIVGVVAGALAVYLLKLPIDTVGTRFGEIPETLPVPRLPVFDWSLARSLIPEATTIALLASIESLLSAVVADGMTGRRHKADCELVAQGVANIASALFGGIPATGAIARTAANIKAGGQTPVAGLIHVLVLIAFILWLSPLAATIPLSCLSAILLMVAWNMSEIHHFRHLLRAPKSDQAVLLITFGLTVFVDLTIAVGVGMVLASLLFMQRMVSVCNVASITRELAEGTDEAELPPGGARLPGREIPEGVEIYEINGPFFFGVADRIQDVLRGVERPPLVFILRMRHVPVIDATGLYALREFHRRCGRDGTVLVLSGVHIQPMFVFRAMGFAGEIGEENLQPHIDASLARAAGIIVERRGYESVSG